MALLSGKKLIGFYEKSQSPIRKRKINNQMSPSLFMTEFVSKLSL